MEKRTWIRSGVREDLDQRQLTLLQLVKEKIDLYYRELYQTRDCYRYPLSLGRLMKLCNRNSYAVISAVRFLANTVSEGAQDRPEVYYYRISAQRNPSHRPYRILLRPEESGDEAQTKIQPDPSKETQVSFEKRN